jgi:hypothetical protein
MKRNFVIGLFSSLIGFGILMLLIHATGSASASMRRSPAAALWTG